MKIRLESTLKSSPNEAWEWITSWHGISKEMAPYFHMSAPKGVEGLTSIHCELGKPMFRSWITLFYTIPIDYSDITLISIADGVGFVEQSSMGSMKFWRHERTIKSWGNGCKIEDLITFEPKFFSIIVGKIVENFFKYRHRVLIKYMG